MQNYTIVKTRKFEKERGRLLSSQNFDCDLLNKIIFTLSTGVKLDLRYRDHALGGDWQGYRECHIKSDILLIYKIRDELNELVLVEIGSHSQLFE